MKNQVKSLVLVIVSSLLTWPVQAEQGGLGRHKRMFAVPRAQPVTIDGRLDDWDLSAQIWMYVTQETSEMQSARFALMYDAEALYLSGDVRDPTPLMNRHDPRVDPDFGWDADVCQFRIVLDPAQGYPVKEGYDGKANDQMAHLTMWYYTDRKEPVLHAKYGMNYALPQAGYPGGVIPRDKFEATYRVADDGRGYTFEYRIPWTTLEARNPPKAGDFVAATVQFNWGRADGLRTLGNAAWAYDVMAGPGFTFQSSASWGKAIFSDKGNLPREQVEEGVPPAPPLPLTFEYDLPEESEVTVQLYDEAGQMVRLLVAQGARRAGRVIEKWDGLDDAGKPLSPGAYTWRGLYHQPLQTRYVLSVHNSGQPPYKTEDNTGGWGGDHGTPQAVCVAGETVALSWNGSEAGWGLIRTDLDGKKQWGAAHNAVHLATDGARIFAAIAGELRAHALADGRPLKFAAGDGQPTGLAFGKGLVYVAYKDRNVITRCDPETGEVKETWNVPAPERLAVHPDGSALVISEGSVLRVRSTDFSRLPLDEIDSPSSIALDAAGHIYIANRGALQNVSVFSVDGKYLGSIGKPGGRPRVGRYDKEGMLDPGGIAVDPRGQLWVAETLDDPKRVSVWDAKTGALVREFFGGSAYATFVSADPQRPDEVYCHNVLWKVNYETGASEPVSTIWRATQPNMVGAPASGGYAGHFRAFTARNDRQYGWGMDWYGNILYRREGDRFLPFAGAINLYPHFQRHTRYPALEAFPDGAYLWQDANDDQTVQPSELARPPGDRGEPLFNWFDADLNAWCDTGFVFRPVRIESNGQPVYDFTQPEPIPFKGHNSNYTSLWLDGRDDAVYTLNPHADDGFSAWTRDGQRRWSFRGIVDWQRAVNLPPIKPGKFHGPTMPLGVAGDFTGVALYFGPSHLVTRDGLYVGMVMKDGRLGVTTPEVIGAENLAGQLFQPAGSNRYFLLAGDQDGRVTEILGLDTVQHLPGGSYTLTETDAKRAAEARAEYERALQTSHPLIIARGHGSLESARGVRRHLDDGRGFHARLAYDAQHLYVAYDVDSPHELVNAITDPHLIFKGGNCLDLQLTTEAGAQRLLITRQRDKPVAVLFRPNAPGFTGQPIVLTSPTGKESFDAITVLSEVQLDYAKTPASFRAVATIPLAVLGWKPAPGETVKLDVGYIFGNATGTQAALRSYWSNHGFSAGVVNDVPNESRLEPDQWGSAAVE